MDVRSFFALDLRFNFTFSQWFLQQTSAYMYCAHHIIPSICFLPGRCYFLFLVATAASCKFSNFIGIFLCLFYQIAPQLFSFFILSQEWLIRLYVCTFVLSCEQAYVNIFINIQKLNGHWFVFLFALSHEPINIIDWIKVICWIIIWMKK